MATAKKAKPKKASKALPAAPKTWRDALRQHLAKVPQVDAVFVNTASETVHVYSVVKEFTDDYDDKLLREESKFEKKFPEIAFEFHTRVHQGRKPGESGPWGSELVYLR